MNELSSPWAGWISEVDADVCATLAEVRSVAVFGVVIACSCSKIESPALQDAGSSSNPSKAPPFALPLLASPVGGPCWVSLVRNADGSPGAAQRCESGLVCDYTEATPDGPGRCRR